MIKPKIQQFIILSGLLWLGLSPVWGEKVILKEGKVLHGKITNENDKEITLLLGRNMVLRVEKEKIKEIVRDQKAPPEKKEIRMDQEATAKERPENVSEKKPASPLLNFENSSSFQSTEKKNTVLRQTRIIQTYDITSQKAVDAFSEIYDRDEGKGFLDRGKRRATETAFSFSWDGASGSEDKNIRWQSITIYSTITIQAPRWSKGEQASNADISLWGIYITRLHELNDGRLDIIERTLSDFSAQALALRQPDEAKLRGKTKALQKSNLEKMKKRIEGYERRHPVEHPE